MNRLHKAIALSVAFSTLLSFLSFLVQSRANKSVNHCSYLDPVTIDVFAFAAALFLVVEGFYSIVASKGDSLKKHMLRAIRISFGCAIITLHIMQVLHKI